MRATKATGFLTKIPTDADAEFLKALHDSKGTANNGLIYGLIKNNGCTAEDVRLVAKKTKNENYLDNTLIRYDRNEYAVKRMMNKMAQRNLGWSTFRDYEWYFKNVPEEYKDYFITENLPLNGLFSKDKLGDKMLGLYSYNYALNLLNKENYPDKFFVERFKATNVGYKTFAEPYNVTDSYMDYSGRTLTVTNYGHRFKAHFDLAIDRFWSDYDREDGKTDLTGTVQRRVLEQMVQADIVAEIMLNECFDEETLRKGKYEDGKKILSYGDYLFSNYRKTGFAVTNHPQKFRLEMFGQTKALEMLLCMGLGIVPKNEGHYNYKHSNKKLVKRIQTAYKTFIKAKTVDDRKAMRALLKDQLTILINDFMGNNFTVMELRCVEKQDEMFEKGTGGGLSVDNKPKVAPVKKNSVYVKKTFDLSKLAQATTKVVEKGRH